MILGGLGEAFGELLADVGGSGASPGGVCSQCFRQGGFRRVPESDLKAFWHFRRVLAPKSDKSKRKINKNNREQLLHQRVQKYPNKSRKNRARAKRA